MVSIIGTWQVNLAELLSVFERPDRHAFGHGGPVRSLTLRIGMVVDAMSIYVVTLG
jgi:hypothetical protein